MIFQRESGLRLKRYLRLPKGYLFLPKGYKRILQRKMAISLSNKTRHRCGDNVPQA